MKSLLYIGADHARLVVALLILLTGIAIVQLPGLRLEITAEGMMVKNDPARQTYENTLETFGSDNVTIIYFQDEQIFQPQKLRLIAQAIKQIEDSPLVHHTDSLFNLRYLRTEQDLLYTSPYLKKIPDNYQQSLAIRDAAQINPLVSKNLLSSSGKALAINVYFDPTKFYRGFDEDISVELGRILNPLKSSFEQVFFIGDPYVRTGISERIRADQQFILPGAILLLIITLAVSLRRIQAAVIPLLTSVISVVWLLGLMAFLGIPVNVMNSVIPALLIIIGSTEDIHLLAEYLSASRRGEIQHRSIDFMAQNMGTAVVLTFVTTYVGFLSISLNDLGLLQQFGWLASGGLLMNFAVTVLLVPACLVIFGKAKSVKQTEIENNFFQVTGLKVLMLTDKHRFSVIVMLLVVTGLATLSMKDLRINNNVMDYFSEDSELVTNSKILHRNISGIQTFSVLLTGVAGTFLQLPYIEELTNVQEFLQESGQIDKSFSFADFVAVVHSGIDGERPGQVYLPETNDVIDGYMSFLGHDVAKTFVSSDYSQAKIIIRHDISNSEHLNKVVDEIYQYAETWLDPVLELQVTGESYLNSRAVDYMAKGQAQSLLLMMAVIFVLISGLFLNTKAGWIALSTNLFPIIILFGVMAFFDIALNTGTAMVAVISLGICVDHTMHFMVRYHRLSKSADSQFQALEDTVRQESMPIMATAIALAVGFGALTISDFPPLARFGQLSALVMLLALISTFVITPLFLRYVRLVTVWDILTVSLKQDVLKNCPLFAGMNHWQARKIIALSEIKCFRQDEAILLQGQKIEHLYIPLEGLIETWRTDKDGSAHMTGMFNPGHVFGALTPEKNQLSPGDMVAISPVRLMLLKSKDIQSVARMFPRLSVKLFKNQCTIVGEFLNRESIKSPKLFDDNSGAYSATIFTEMVSSMINRANRYSEPLSMVVVEPEYPEQMKLKGVTALRTLPGKVADIIQDKTRKPDLLGLWSDGSYWIAMPKTNSTGAALIARRIVSSFHNSEVVENDLLSIAVFFIELVQGDTFEKSVIRINLNRQQEQKRQSMKNRQNNSNAKLN